jgi:2-(1,2-epoxy-1,2-dihydrophenyl)acetyl-CoA isomerase
MPEALLVVREGPVCTLSINRPDRRNALTPDLAKRLVEALKAAGEDDAVRVVALRGEGGHFSAGLDLHWVSQLGRDVPDATLSTGLKDFQSIIHAVVESPLPVIAACEGTVAGFGLDLALACDLRYADPSARFTSAFAMMGLVPDGGSTSTLPRTIGQGKAFRFLVDGSTMDAEEALRVDLVDHLVPAGGLPDAVTAFASAIRSTSRRSIAVIKYLIERHNGSGWADTLDAEGRAQLQALRSDDFHDRMAAFVTRGP